MTAPLLELKGVSKRFVKPLDMVARVANVAGAEIREEVVHAFSDHEKLHRVFGQERAVSLEDGLRRMAEWARETGVHEAVRFESVEVLRNLPPSWAAGLTQTA